MVLRREASLGDLSGSGLLDHQSTPLKLKINHTVSSEKYLGQPNKVTYNEDIKTCDNSDNDMDGSCFDTDSETEIIDYHVTNADGNFQQQQEFLNNLEVYGYILIIGTWVLFIFSIGTILNLWQWCFKLNIISEHSIYLDYWKSFRWIDWLITCIKEQNQVLDNYYIFVFFLNFVILWIWAVASWISMKLFRHSKGGGS